MGADAASCFRDPIHHDGCGAGAEFARRGRLGPRGEPPPTASGVSAVLLNGFGIGAECAYARLHGNGFARVACSKRICSASDFALLLDALLPGATWHAMGGLSEAITQSLFTHIAAAAADA